MLQVISLGQFRPEKNHSLQLAAMAALRTSFPATKARLVIIGMCACVYVGVCVYEYVYKYAETTQARKHSFSYA